LERKKLKVSVISNENKQINFIFKNTNSIEDKQINSTNLNNSKDEFTKMNSDNLMTILEIQIQIQI